ncbi:MAG: SDR family NAD(P)-dependent oxidoreductase [Gemmatimonadota bacterium]
MDLHDRTVFITGSTAGVGASAARRLAARGARVLLHGRDEKRGEALLTDIAAAGGAAELISTDLSSLAAVRDLAEAVRERAPALDALVLNAGLARAPRETTAEGYERTFAVNHLAHFLLAHLLLDTLRAAAADREARIVVVASNAHRRADLRLDRVADPAGYDGWRAYANSKLANVLFAREAARRWADHGVTVNALHPGVLATRIWDRNRRPLWFIARLFKVFMESPDVGGAAVERLVAEPALGSVTGQYFDVMERAEPSLPGHHERLQAELWERSAGWVGLAD